MTKNTDKKNFSHDQKEKKQIILKAAQKRFVKHGLHKTTLDEIARDLRIGKSSLYHYFKSKEELFLATIEWEIQTYLQNIADIFNDESASPPKRFRNFLMLKYYLKKKYRLIFNLLVLDLQGSSTQEESELILKLVNEESHLLKLFLDAVSTNATEANDLNTSYFLSLQSFMLIFVHQLFLKKMDPYDPAITEKLMKNFEKMISIDTSAQGFTFTETLPDEPGSETLY